MKNYLLLLPVLGLCACAHNRPPEPPPPLAQVGVPAHHSSSAAHPADNQRLYGGENATLVAPENAQKIVEQFRTAYSSPAAPRIVVYVNRELVSPAGMKLTGHTEKYEKTESNTQSDLTLPAPATTTHSAQTQVNVVVGGHSAEPPAAAGQGSASQTTTKTTGENTYQLKDGTALTLADRQTVREVERLFGRAFRNAGAKLADQNVAASLIPDEPGHRLVGDQAAKDRQALSQIADVVVEVLISSRNLTSPEISGDKTYAVPDIQATAIRLKDSAVIGQASASDVLGKDRFAGHLAQQFDMRDITEATALALMEDMLTGAK